MTRYVKAARLFILLTTALVFCGCTRLRPTESHFLESGKSKLAHGDYARALLEFRNAAKLAPHDPEPFYQMALAYETIGDLQSTVACLRKAIEVDSKCSRAQVKLAELMASGANGDKNLLAEAERRARAALGSPAEEVKARLVLALILWQQGKRQEAEQVAEQTVQKFPQDTKAALALAKIELALGQASVAEQVLQKAAMRSPGAEADLALANLYLSTGRNSDAERLFRSVAQRDPKHAEALLGLAALQSREGQMDQAERTYRQVSSIPLDKYRPLHAEFLLYSGHPDRAIAELEQLVKQSPKNRQFSALLLSTYLAANRKTAAEELLDNLLKQNPKNRDALLQRAKLYISDHKLREAQLDLDHVITLQPDSAEAHYVKASLHRFNGEELNARQELSEVLTLNPGYLAARVELAEALMRAKSPQSALVLCDSAPPKQKNTPQLIAERNRALLALGNLQELRTGIDHGLKLAKTPELILQDAELRLRQRDFAGARADAQTVLLKQPDNVNALDLLARTYTAQKQIAAAIEAVRQYAASRPSSVPVQEFLAQVLAAHGDLDQSRQIFDTLRNKPGAAVNSEFALAQIDFAQHKFDEAQQLLTPLAAGGNMPATLYLAAAQASAGRVTAAMEGYRKVLASDSANVVALNNLAFLLLEHGGNSMEALKFAESAAERAPDDPYVQGTLAIALYRNGVYQAAKRHMEIALAKQDNAIRRYYLSLIYDQLGNRDQSRRNFQAALRLDPKAIAERQTPH